MLADELMSLASLAGRTVVTAAVTDGWEAAKQGLAWLLGRGDAGQAGLAERRLEQTREDLTSTAPGELERVQSRLEAAWQTRMLDLLEEHPEMVTDLLALVERVQDQLSAEAASTPDQRIAAGRDVNISAASGGVAAGTVHGSVTGGNPTGPGSVSR